MTKRTGNPLWFLFALLVAGGLSYITFVGSVLNSCGAGNHGPNPGAEEEFCGYSSGEPTDFSGLFLFVNLIPAIPVLVGGLFSALGHSRIFFAAGLGLGLLAPVVIWMLEP
jgi:hypothetical protein